MNDLKTDLLNVADAWAQAHAKNGKPAALSRLGKAVAGDACFFDRIGSGGGLQLATLEKFSNHLIKPSTWPKGAIPAAAFALAQRCGIEITLDGGLS